MEELTFDQRLIRQGRAQGLAEGEVRGPLEGQVREARAMLLRQAQHQFRPITPADRWRINRIADRDRLHRWADRVLDTSTCAEFWARAGGKDPSS